ncbi:glycoside hydrolase family 68 protein [Nanoarchaeota archaeon]
MQNYAPKDKCLWDAWFIEKDDEIHMFHLQAKWPEKQEDRHDDNVEIGHAVSTDLIEWTELPTALKPGSKGEWDDLALWTGSVIKKDNTYYMFYTARTKTEQYVQRIGIAASIDLINWTKHPANPILEADKEFYQMENQLNELDTVPAWRDPYVFKHPNEDKYYMTISARAKGPRNSYNGCIAIAESTDLLNWKVLPPIISPFLYEEMETTQVIFHKGKVYLFFSTHKSGYSPEHAEKYPPTSGLHGYVADTLFGEYTPLNDYGLVYGHGYDLYDIRLIPKDKDSDEFTAIAWLNKDKDGNFIGRLTHPFTIVIQGDKAFKP